MKKAAAVLLLALTGSMLFGCGGKNTGSSGFHPESSSIYVTGDGRVSSALVEAYEKDNYDENSLKTYLDSEISRYGEANEGQGDSAPVSLKECTVKNGKMTAVFEYASPEDMIKFAEAQQDDSMSLTSLEVKNAVDALSGGDVSDGTFFNAKKEAVKLDDVRKENEAKAVIASGEGLIRTEGKILFVSEGVELDSAKNTAKVTGETSYIIFK
ncbi:hypothetical protein [Clostridium sp. AM58-1XD]|uniref:hypothetical protein n=1 Tax=Clostridium sp. AM58-1XD TaxID=2292307 RepID=UPI000E54D803|nr:hypothetical protein [Clostridium sp. AM58-1XD]RGY97041.1 hypothetical protein DXA13_15720 [Clostridium sp. AM58-1XD]